MTFDIDADPVKGIIGTYNGKADADKQITEMLGDNGVSVGLLNHKRSGFKMIQNGKLWVAWYSNAMQDRQKEYFPRNATDRFISAVDRGVLPNPELWWFHVKGAKHGDALLLGRIGLLTLGVGKFDDSPIAEKFKSYYLDNQMGNSHGFYYDPMQFVDGAYNSYYTFEISTLPPDQAANPFTVFEVFSKMDANKIKALAAIVGDSDAELIVGNTAETSKQLKAMGAKFKAFAAADEPDADDEKKKKPTAPTADAATKAIDDRFAAVENTMLDGFKALATQLGGILNPLGDTLVAHQKATAALQEKVDRLETGLKQVAGFLKDEYALQPPATQSSVTVPQPNDPGMQFMQYLQNQQNQQGQGQKSANPLGMFGEIFGALGVGGKAMQQPPFEVPGAFGTPAVPTQAPAAPQQSQQGFQPNGNPQQGQQPANMQGFVESLLGGGGQQPQNFTPNNTPGVGIPRLGQ